MAKIVIDAELCKGCELCMDVCPFKLISIGSVYNSKGIKTAIQENADKCTGCRLCGIMCPDAAISVYR